MFFKRLGLNISDQTVEVGIRPMEIELPTDRKNVALCVGSPARLRRFRPTVVNKFADVLSRKYNVYVIGRTYPAVAKDIDPKNAKNLVNQTSLREFANLIKNMDAIVTPDSGPLWLGEAFCIPTVLAASTKPYREIVHPMYENLVKLIPPPVDCCPCNFIESAQCPYGRPFCLESIDPEVMMSTLESVITQNEGFLKLVSPNNRACCSILEFGDPQEQQVDDLDFDVR
jgi:ADP-heptose:LPS heptosyltransferase